MKQIDQSIQFSASDLVNYLGCKYLTELDRSNANGLIAPPDWKNPSLELLQQKGQEHEKAYIDYLKTQGLSVCELDGQSVKATKDAISKGYDIITQARFHKEGWVGIADILKKVSGSSNLGDYHYEVEDTKLSQETKAGTVLQLCLYSDLLSDLQGKTPENMFVIKPGIDFPVDKFRYSEFESYYRFVKGKFQELMINEPVETYPLPVGKCDTCRWWKSCNDKWHKDDHLTLIAGIRSNHIKELGCQGINTLEVYAKEPQPFRGNPEQGNKDTYSKIHNQAKIQLKGRTEEQLLYELLPIEPLRGLNELPVPSRGDIYFDIEGDHFYDDGGIEYLFGISYLQDGNNTYKGFWAKNRKEEKQVFCEFMTLVMNRWQEFPDMHIYHYAPYEPTAIKKLASRCAVFEEEVDRLLRAELFKDLFSVIKESLIASVESYSLKEMEQFADYKREANLKLASDARRRMSVALDFNDFATMTQSTFELIELYNRDDCFATQKLHFWLENIYQEQIKNGIELSRPEIKTGNASETIEEKDAEARSLYNGLVTSLPADPENWKNEDTAKWLLAHQIEFYRRELKSSWWEFFRLRDLEDHELLDERKGIFGLKYLSTHPDSKKVPIHTYSYSPQEISLEVGKDLHQTKGEKIGQIYDFSLENKTVDIKKTKLTAEIHPIAVFINDIVSPGVLIPSLFKFAKAIIDQGIDGDGAYRAGRDLLLKNPPRLSEDVELKSNDAETTEATALRLALSLNNGVLPIQGPPGTGKTHLGGSLIAELSRRGKKIGVTAVSHKVIRNLLDKAVERGLEKGMPVVIKHKGKSGEEIDSLDTVNIKNKEEAISSLNSGAVVGGTAWLWADDVFEGMLDYLFVDEAGQMSLTNVITISRAAKNIILLGDPQQLEQPTKGAHPEGADISALEHILDGHPTMPIDKGIFLDTTWRLNPKITEFTSKLYYEGRLRSKEGLEKQIIEGNTIFNGSGLFYVPVNHIGNQSQALEEVTTIRKIVEHLLSANLKWVDRNGKSSSLTKDDILIIAPYNAQVSVLKESLPDFPIGTVDKFQGQEAPIVIYSMTSSSPEDAPRGMSFLYNPNRLNVATSRAKCISILVAAPKLFEAECHTIDQMRWANGLCLYQEMSICVDMQ